MLNLKTGRTVAIHTRRSMRSALVMGRTLDALGAGPIVTNDWVAAVDAKTGGDWGMDGNDTAGCCTIADCAHGVMLRTANASTLVTPTTANVLAVYSAITGYDSATGANDTGANELDVCAYMKSTGIIGHKSDDYGTIDPTNLDHVRWGVQLFGSVRLGILVTPAMIQQFEAGQPWTQLMTDATPDGHDVPIVKGDGEWAYVVTWGRLQRVAWSMISDPRFCDEAHAELYFDWIREQGQAPSLMNLNQLDADLKYIAEPVSTVSITTAIDHGALEAAKYDIVRSPHWPTVAHDVLAKIPTCIACDPDQPVEHVGLQVHHMQVSFHVAKLLGRPDLELDEHNLTTLGETEENKPAPNHHLVIGHANNFERDCNPHIDEDAVRFRGWTTDQIKADPTWLAHAADAPPTWVNWTREMKVSRRQWLDTNLPPDTSPTGPIVRWPECAPVPFDAWLATLPPE